MNELMQNLLKLQSLEFSPTQDDSTAALIAELRDKIPPQIVGHYDRLRVRGKKGLAAVQNQVCTGCHMRLPLAVIMTLKHDQDIQLCDSCGRYLYLAPEAPAAPITETPAAKPARKSARRKKVAKP
ncbi:MAG: hypothetical protein KIS67_20990 [Verrucomicrobiae bacterium]|nr:hypothetical protein [Verrucomicrobiae bacterium]